MLGFGLQYGRVSIDGPQLKWYMTSAPGMIGMEERGSDGLHSSSSSSPSSAADPRKAWRGQGVEPTLTNTRPAPLLKRSLIFTLSSMVVMILHMNVCCFTYGRRTFSAVSPHEVQYGAVNVYIRNPLLCVFVSPFFS